MTVTYVILMLCVFHFVADFLCQNQWMATNKSKALWPLWAHALTYTAVLWFLGLIFFFLSSYRLTVADWTLYSILSGLIHCFVDFNTSRINAWMWNKVEQAKKAHDLETTDFWVHWFFVGIGFDQLLHTLSLVLVAKYYFNF